MVLINKEKRKLKEQDLSELQMQQKRIKHQKKVLLANKKTVGDEIKQTEGLMRDTFIRRV